MRKICLSVVLTVVSIFSISDEALAQTNKSAENIKAAENVTVKTDSPETKIEKITVSDKTSEAISSEEKKPVVEQKPEIKAENQNAETKLEVKTEDKLPQTSETVKKEEEQKPLAVETEKKTETPGLQSKKTLGALSTGDATIDGYIEEFSELYNVDPLLIYAQMSQESSFKGRATSSKGASGFMQLMPDTARRFGVTNIYNPKQNIKAGVKYMRWLLDKFGGDVSLALAGYNAGEGSVIKFGNKIPPYRETQDYVARIMNHYTLISTQDATLASTLEPSDK